MSGKAIRLSRLMNRASNRICIVPIDHGVTLGPIDGIADIVTTINRAVSGGADAIVVHKGPLIALSKYPELTNKGKYILHLSASTVQSADPTYKVMVATVEEAIKLGADGVSVHINLGTTKESEMVKDLGTVSKACMEWGMPLLVMIYTHKIPKQVAHAAHAARLAEELGADIIKVSCIGAIEEIKAASSGVRVPIVVAGGEYGYEPNQLLEMINDSLIAGAAGVAIGRNIFQSNNQEWITSIIAKLVHKEWKLPDCLHELKKVSLVG